MAEDALIVNIKNGALKGSIYKSVYGDTIYSFEGIPYGKRPVGKLRFADPVPAEPWEGVKSAENPPPIAPTMTIPMIGVEQPLSSEDCLYLNIFMPKRPSKNLNMPVMVYIHGGGFAHGTGNKDICGPDYLVPHGIILVTINYRLGALGFLSFQTAECPGNFGLKDQSLGLRWVKDNIPAFGGDANNITIFGESAGSVSVHYHALSPLSKGLFHKAIAMSGTSLNRWGFGRFPRETASFLAKKLGCPNSDDPHEAFIFLQNAPLEKIINAPPIFAEVQDCWAGEHIFGLSFVPTKEPEGTPNAFLTKTPEKAIEDGDFADVPFIAGVCSHEAIFSLPDPDFIPDCNDITVLEKMLPKELEVPLGSKKSLEAAERLKDFYFPNGPTQEDYIRATSLLTMGYGIYQTMKKTAKNASKTTPNYLYEFAASREHSIIKKQFGFHNIKGVCHADDLEYLFPTTSGFLASDPIKPGTIEEKVKNTLTRLWTDFAKTGKVTPEWKPVTSSNEDPYIVITDKLEPRKGYFSKDIKFWDGIYKFMKDA